MSKQKRSFLGPFVAVLVTLMGIGCGGELPTSPQMPTAMSAAPDSGDGRVTAQSNGTLHITISVNNDDGAWFGANHVAHVVVDNTTSYRVGNEFDYMWQDSVNISLSPGPHTVVLVNDIPNYYALESDPASTIGNVTISSGVTTNQSASYNDCTDLSCS